MVYIVGDLSDGECKPFEKEENRKSPYFQWNCSEGVANGVEQFSNNREKCAIKVIRAQ